MKEYARARYVQKISELVIGDIMPSISRPETESMNNIEYEFVVFERSAFLILNRLYMMITNSDERKNNVISPLLINMSSRKLCTTDSSPENQ